MNVGCVVKGLVIAGILGLIGYFAAMVSGLNDIVPVASLFSTGLSLGYLIGVFVSWRTGHSCAGRKKSVSNANVLYVGNIPFKAREDEVQRLFETYGSVKSVRLVRGGPSRRPKGYGFVEMGRVNADKAINSLNGHQFSGRALKVGEANERSAW